jgi:hypothetical protein
MATEVKNVISFDEIIPYSSVRFTLLNGVQYISIRDIIMVMCGKDNNQAGEVWRKLPDDKKSEVQVFVLNFKFPGRGQSEQPVIQFQGAIKLLMWLPGEQAKQFRSKAADILTRYYAGDKTLLSDIYANAESHSVINEAARAALPQVTLSVDDECTRKRKAAELAALEESVEMSRIDRRLKEAQISEMQAKTQESLLKSNWELQTQCMEKYAGLCHNSQMDDRTRMHFKDVFVNLSNTAQFKLNAVANVGSSSSNAFPAIADGSSGSFAGANGGTALVTAASSVTRSPNAPITISTVAAEIGLRFATEELQSIGCKVKKMYLQKYGTSPPKHEQMVGQAVRNVCSYTERDRGMIEEVLRGFKK